MKTVTTREESRATEWRRATERRCQALRIQRVSSLVTKVLIRKEVQVYAASLGATNCKIKSFFHHISPGRYLAGTVKLQLQFTSSHLEH